MTLPPGSRQPLFRKVDSVQLRVPHLEDALAFYRDRLGHQLHWRTETAAGLSMPESDCEIVLRTSPIDPETDLLVTSADEAVERFTQAGGKVLRAPFDIAVGRCAVVEDPWGNELVLLDLSKGFLQTDAIGAVLTNPDGTLRVERADPPVGNLMESGATQRRTLHDIPSEVLEQVTTRILAEQPDALAILVHGSYAAGQATRLSDLDIVTLTSGEPPGHADVAWFEPISDRLLHVSTGAVELNVFLENVARPAAWSLGFPTEEPLVPLHEVDNVVREKLGDPPFIRRPASEPELEDFVEYTVKVRIAGESDDGVAVRWHARNAARLAPGLLLALNKEVRVRDALQAVRAGLALQVCPPRYHELMPMLLGLEARPTDVVARASLDLAHSLLRYLRDRRPDVDPQPELARYLTDGTLERYIES
jgi:lactoylglutathione lyase